MPSQLQQGTAAPRITLPPVEPIAGQHALSVIGSDAHLVPQTPYIRFVKPTMDKVLALLTLLAVTPLMALVSLVVFVSLGAPIILRQQRVGQGGKTFTVYKFRTMHPDRRAGFDFNASVLEDRRITHKHPDDPRLTPSGRLLRKLSLDELPQLVNVLKGEMSIVGPRPELPGIVELHYAAEHHRRHDVRPGITGLWQVSERGNGMMHDHVDVDLHYVRSVSLATDVRILLQTVPAALSSRQGF